MERTTEEKVLGGLTHVAIFFSWIGLIANVIIYVVYREKSRFVSGFAKQAMGLQLVGIVVGAILSTFLGLGVFGMGFTGATAGMAVFGGVGIIALLFGLLMLVLIILGAVKGFTGQEYRHPIIGDLIARIGE